MAVLLHYTTETWQLAGEFDDGHNAFNTGNCLSGSGPGDAFGFPTCVTTPAGTVPRHAPAAGSTVTTPAGRT